MEKNQLAGFLKEIRGIIKMNKVAKVFGMILLLLGIAFFIGAFLAYAQNIVSQITVLAAVGCICLVCAAVVFAVGKLTKKS